MNKQMNKHINKLRDLAPWHFDIELPDGTRTSDGNKNEYHNDDHKSVHLITPEEMIPTFDFLYPNGLKGKRFLDVGCNAGGYSLLVNRLGAKYCYGFDVRDHWINQAQYLSKVFKVDKSKVKFEVKHVEDLSPDLEFDLVLFKGVFYHLPDPIHSLLELAKLAKESIIVDSASRTNLEPNTLKLNLESESHVMSGVDKLAWVPSGPEVIQNILACNGFNHFKVIYNHNEKVINHNWGRFRIVATR